MIATVVLGTIIDVLAEDMVARASVVTKDGKTVIVDSLSPLTFNGAKASDLSSFSFAPFSSEHLTSE